MSAPPREHPAASFPVALAAGELSLLRAWIDACHRTSPSRSHIKDEGFFNLQDDLRIGSTTSDAGVDPDAPTRAALQRLVDVFLARLLDRFPDQHGFVREGSRRLQFNVLSYRSSYPGEVVSGVPYHQDRAPTTILFAFLVTRPEQGGAFEVLDLDTATTECLAEEGRAMVFDDRSCLHRVHDLTGHRQALTLRVW